MRADGFLIIGFLLFIFVVWFGTGGPKRPITKQGPFITPITTPDSKQVGYGSLYPGYGTASYKSIDYTNYSKNKISTGGVSSGSLNTTQVNTQNTQTTINALQQQVNDLKETGYYSSLKGKVKISLGNIYGNDPQTEYLSLYISGNEPVDITGFTLVSTSTKYIMTIPNAKIIAGKNGEGNYTSTIVSPGDTVYLSTGRSPIGASFKENACSGYLSTDYSFTPSLSSYQCPTPLDELRTFYTADAASYIACKNYLSNTYRCSGIPESPKTLPSSCRLFIEQRLTYEGCLTGHKDDSNFSNRTWRLYFDQTKKLWNSTHGKIRLLDREKNIVDVYTY
jgi:hypothetical protein